MARRPSVAGTFYDEGGNDLRRSVEALLKTDEGSGPEHLDAIGLMAPHAAYMYSGKVAGRTYSRVDIPEDVIILAPNHTGLGKSAAVGLDSPWVTPMGNVVVNRELAHRLIQAGDILVEDDLAHVEEHSVEVHLPFLLTLNPSVRIVPICLRTMSYELCEELGRTLASVVGGERCRILLVASSDMNHHEPRQVAARKDRMALDRIVDLDPKSLYRVVVDHHVSMCGFIPTVVMLLAAKALGAGNAELTDYATSGDVNHDLSSVIGYAGVVVGR